MAELNGTQADHIHRIFISAPKPTGDRTALYVLILLCLLLFILMFYLVYNFISYRRYVSSQKHKELSRSVERKSSQSIVRSHRMPPRTRKSLPMPPTYNPMEKTSLSNQYLIRNQLVSDL